MSSYGDLLRWGEQRLDHSQRAGFLLEDAAARSLVWLRAHAKDAAPADIEQRYRDWVERVAGGPMPMSAASPTSGSCACA